MQLRQAEDMMTDLSKVLAQRKMQWKFEELVALPIGEFRD